MDFIRISIQAAVYNSANPGKPAFIQLFHVHDDLLQHDFIPVRKWMVRAGRVGLHLPGPIETHAFRFNGITFAPAFNPSRYFPQLSMSSRRSLRNDVRL